MDLKRNELLIHAKAWMKHENTKVSERSQSYKATLYMMPFMPNAQNSEIHEDGKKIGGYQGESIETESRLMAARGCGGAGSDC